VNEVLKVLVEADRFSDAEIVHLRNRPAGASSLDVSAAAFADAFGWRPMRSLEQGLSDTIGWYRRNAPLTR